ncbi:hypothetical protein CG709_11080 [Lachnotalea glycerini]|nr:hypothetical protein CG709_11080 [Lachnotalea glycerini]
MCGVGGAAAGGIVDEVAQGRAGKMDQRQLDSYLRNKQNKGGLTSQEQEVAKKLGVSGGNEGSGGNHGVDTDSFYIDDWTGYPDAPKPEGSFKILEGSEYDTARKLANNTNAKLHRQYSHLDGVQIHEMHPVKFGGSPTDIDNKIALTQKEHAQYTKFWNKILREQKGKKK